MMVSYLTGNVKGTSPLRTKTCFVQDVEWIKKIDVKDFEMRH